MVVGEIGTWKSNGRDVALRPAGWLLGPIRCDEIVSAHVPGTECASSQSACLRVSEPNLCSTWMNVLDEVRVSPESMNFWMKCGDSL